MLPTWVMNTMLSIDDKPWGKCYHFSETPDEQLDLCEIVAGGYSSIHLHEFKNNLFVVVSGLVRVRKFDSSLNVLSERVIGRGECITVSAGYRHDFLAVEATRLVEVYWRIANAPPVQLADIKRFSENGVDYEVAKNAEHAKRERANEALAAEAEEAAEAATEVETEANEGTEANG